MVSPTDLTAHIPSLPTVQQARWYVLAGIAGVALGLFLGWALHRWFETVGKHQGKPRWPRDWPKAREMFTKDPDPTKPGYLDLSPMQAMGSGAMPLGRTYPRWGNLIPDKFPLRELRRAVIYASSRSVWVPYAKRFQHFFVLGKTGGGKSTAYAIPILTYGALERTRQGFPGTSYFAIDVKSPQFIRMFSNLYKQAGKDVLLLDCWTIDETLGFEPLWRATEERKDIIADVIVTYSAEPGSMQSSENSEFFKLAATRAFRAYIDLAQFWPRRYCNLPSLQQLIGAGGPAMVEALEKATSVFPSLDETLAAMEQVLPLSAAQLRDGARSDLLRGALAVVDRSGYRMAFTLKRMRRFVADHAAGKLTDAQRAECEQAFWAQIKHEWLERRLKLDAILMSQGEFIKMPDDTRNSVVSTVTNKSNWFKDENIARAFSRDELDVRSLTQRPCLLIVGAPMAKLKVGAMFVSSMVTNLALNAVFQRGMAIEKKAKGVSKHGVFFMLDEFPQLGIKDAPQILATFRGFLSGLVMVFQERGQLKQLYGENATTMEANTIHKILLGGAHPDTAKFFSDAMGNVQVKTESESGIAGEKKNVSRQTQSMPLMETNDIIGMRLNGAPMPGMALSVGSDTPAFPVRPVPFYEDPTLRKLLGLARELQRTGFSGQPTKAFWQWKETWNQATESPPYLRRRKALSPAERAAGTMDPVWARQQDPYTQFLDYLLGDTKGVFDELVAPVLQLADIGVTENDPKMAAMAAAKAGGAVPRPGQPIGAAGGAPAAAPKPAAPIAPMYGPDFRVLINDDYQPNAHVLDVAPIGGLLAERIALWQDMADDFDDALESDDLYDTGDEAEETAAEGAEDAAEDGADGADAVTPPHNEEHA